MVRQYRIDRLNGLEVLVCEVYRKHTWSQSEYEAFHAWKCEREKSCALNYCIESNFSLELNEWLDSEHDSKDSFFGLVEPVSVYDPYPAIVLRGVVIDNRIASLQVDYVSSVLSPEIFSEVNKFYGVMDSRHWRNMVSHQVDRYGSLFESDND